MHHVELYKEYWNKLDSELSAKVVTQKTDCGNADCLARLGNYLGGRTYREMEVAQAQYDVDEYGSGSSVAAQGTRLSRQEAQDELNKYKRDNAEPKCSTK